MKLQIRPLIAMECSVIEKKYMGLGLTPAAYDEFVKLKNACRNVNSAFTLLWHNSQFRTNKSCVMYEAIRQA